MFQTEPILWLQTHGSPAFAALMAAVSLVGHVPVYSALLLGLAFGVRLRPGLTLLAAVLLSGILSEVLKAGIALPRPEDVDTRVRRSAEAPSPAVAERGGARGFFALPPAEAVAAVRARGRGSFGFPSGHVASATAFGLGLACAFRWRSAWALAACWSILMALSRMALGRHFLADVVGGLAVGAASTLLALGLFPASGTSALRPRARRSLPLLLGLPLLALAPFVPLLHPWYVGAFAGLATAEALWQRSGSPPDEPVAGRRRTRVALAYGLLAATALGALLALVALDALRSRTAALLSAFAVVLTTLTGSALFARRLGPHEGR